jgi:methyl-accepting chemotaxis protein
LRFANRYLIWLLGPPALAGIPLSLLFLSQVVHLTLRDWVTLLGLGAISAIAALWMVVTIRPYANAIGEAGANEDLSKPMSECLQVTMRSAVTSWVVGAAVFATLGALFIVPTRTGFLFFLVAALIAAAPSIVWSYAAGKAMLLSENYRKARTFHYVGRELRLGKKLAIVFIGLFVLAIAVVVLLVSARVSTSLEKTAVGSEEAQFEIIHARLNELTAIDRSTLAATQNELAREHDLLVIRRDGEVVGSNDAVVAAFTKAEIAEIRRFRNGDSTYYVGPNVARFRPLADDTILVMRIPFDDYAAIPEQIVIYTIIVGAITTLIFIAATLFLSREVTGPLRELARSAARLAEGDFVTEARIFSDDEIGTLALSFDETRRNLRGLIGRMSDRGKAITDGVRVLSGGTETLVTGAREQSELTKSSSTSLGSVRKGAESVLSAAEKVSARTEDSSGRATELQASAEEVAGSMEYLFQSVEKTSSSIAEMDAAARSMSGRTEVLSNIGEEVLSFVAEMDATVAELRGSAASTAEISRQVREDASAGSVAVAETMSGIEAARDTTMRTAGVLDDLERSIRQISQILAVIEEVTNKTNLLSLNAAIIAAQAGEQGSSFTVVADEIRELADRTRGSTKEIAGIVKAIQKGSRDAVTSMHEGIERVQQNVELVRNAATSLGKIEQSAGRSYEMANRISAALAEQAEASRHLHDVSSKMSDHIAEITKATAEQARGTQMLAREAERVRDIALQVRNSTDQQTVSAGGINDAMEQISSDIASIRAMLQSQLAESERIANASTMMLEIAQASDSIAQEFKRAIGEFQETGRSFDDEVKRFRVS